MTSLVSNAVVRVSSVLNRDAKQFGKSFMFDGNEETCWNSDQGLPQFIQLEFEQEVTPKILVVQFQGGFAGKDCSVKVQKSKNSSDWITLTNFYPKDVSTEQKFEIPCSESVQKLKIVFDSSTDFYGRITIYKLDIL